ncbi:ATP-binding protein [Candidatus Woesearchaeota archaeon]|nr:ATP-binding protein [Candidatus Woesearchaeota archaeon]
MIVEITIQNFLSIKEPAVLSLDAGSSKKLAQNLIALPDKENLLRSVAVYGANASGKSNLIHSVFFMWFLVKNSHNFNVDQKFNKMMPTRQPFKLDSAYINKPSKFEIIFIKDDVKYKYGFSCNDEKIVDEYLYFWPKGREALIFSRTNSKEFKFTDDKPQQKLIEKQMTDNVLYLSRATQLGFEKTRSVYEFIVNDIVINPNQTNLTMHQIHEDKEIKAQVLKILKKTDFGGIIDLEVKKELRKVNGLELKFGNEGAIINPLKETEKEFYDVKFVHYDNNKKEVRLDIDEESHGTQKTIALLGLIFDILKTGKTLFIDEFELNLHPNITEFLIKLFHSKYNEKNGQLVITTHDTTLLKNKDLFRRDQVYICSKAPNKWTELNSLLNFDLRETLSFENAYLNGRVGGLPFIDETFFEAEDG